MQRREDEWQRIHQQISSEREIFTAVDAHSFLKPRAYGSELEDEDIAEVKKLLPTLGDGDELLIRTNPEVGRALRDKEHSVVEEIHDMTGKDVAIKTDPLLHFEQFDIVEM